MSETDKYILEKHKLERLLSTDGELRALIPRLLENKLYYDKLKKFECNWERFKDLFVSIKVEIGDACEIFDLLQ